MVAGEMKRMTTRSLLRRGRPGPAWTALGPAAALVFLAVVSCDRDSGDDAPGPVPRPANEAASPPSGTMPADHPPVLGPDGRPVGAGGGPAPAPPPPPTPSGAPSAGGLTWDAPEEPLTREAPSSPMRKAQYAIRPEDPSGSAAQLTVFYFGPGQGGSVQDNLDRWVQQVDPPGDTPPEDAAEVTRDEVRGMPVSLVTSVGTFAGLDGVPHDDWRLLGAIIEGPEGPVFFKLTGPKALVDRGESAFRALVQSLRPAG